MAKRVSLEELKNVIREIVKKAMSEKPEEGYVRERSLTAAEEKKKEELVKALKPKYGKTPKTYAIATAQAKKLAEEFFEDSDSEEFVTRDQYDSQVIAPRDGINASNKWLGIVFKNDEVDDNRYFDSEDEASSWCDDCCKKGQEMDERMLAFPDKTRTPGRNKKNLPKHAPVSKTLDEVMEEMMEDLNYTDKYDDHSDLTKDQGKNLPDQLQKAIINKKKSDEVEEIRGLGHPTKRVSGAHGKKNLPKHSPVTSNIDEERMLPHSSIRVVGTRRKHTLPNHAPVTTAPNERNK